MKERWTFPYYNWISLIVLIAWGFFLVQLMVWWYWPTNVIEYFGCPATVLNPEKQVKRGEYLEFELEYEKLMNLPAKISRSLVNDRVVTLTCETGATEPDGRKKSKIRVFIPMNVWPGRYKLLTEVTYRVNPLREEHERYETEWFEVVE